MTPATDSSEPPASGRGPVAWFAGRRTEEDRRALELLRALVSRHRPVVILSLLAMLLAALCEGSTMGLLALALSTLADDAGGTLVASLGTLGDSVTSLRESLGKNGLFLLLVGLAVGNQWLRSGLQYGSAAAVATLYARIEADVRGRIFRQFMHLSFRQVSRYSLGELTTYSEQAACMGKTVHLLNQLVGQVLMALTCLAVLFWLSWPLTLAVLAAMVLISIALRRIIRRIRRISERFSRASVELNQRTLEYLGGLRLVRTFAREEYAIATVDRVLHESIAANRRVLVWQGAITPLVESLSVLGVAAFLMGGYWLLGSQDPGVLTRLATFVVILYRILPRVSHIQNAQAALAHQWPLVLRITNILRRDDKEYTLDGGRPLETLCSEIEFRDVSLRYQAGDDWAVRNLSFTIPRGSHVALVGKSGAGKSTIADLLLRLYDPTSGAILVDGVDLREIMPKSWRERIGVVSQETFAFNASIRDNIAFGRLDATPAQITAAAEMAHADEFIAQLSAGYETPIGQRGTRLSGGQLQRLAIARAVLRTPDLLILDEATSALDSRSEQLIQSALASAGRNRTVLAIAHRLSTISAADLILVLDAGQIVEQGTHAHLLSLDGYYARFWHLQSQLIQARSASE